MVELQQDIRVTMYKNLKTKLQNVLCSNNVCCVCLECVKDDLIHVDDVVFIKNWEKNSTISVKRILNKLFANTTLFTSIICDECKNKILDLYVYITETERNHVIVNEYLSQVEKGIENVFDHVNRKEDYGNAVIVLEDPDVEVSEADVLYRCEYCNFISQTKISIEHHIKQMHKHYICFECQTDVCVHKPYLDHYKQQSQLDIVDIRCLDCDHLTKTRRELIKHVNIQHLNLFKYNCETCNKKFPLKVTFDTHNRLYHVKTHKCMYCEKKYKSRQTFNKHIQICRQMEREYKCDVCPASFEVNSRLIIHKLHHEGLYPCYLCDDVFHDELALQNHRLTHSKTQTQYKALLYQCSVCKEQFFNAKDRKQHMLTHNSSEKHHCSLCDKTYDTRAKYLSHTYKYSHRIKVDPNAQMPYKCSYCNFSVTVRLHLEAHVNRYHLKVAPHKCNYCDKSFLSRAKQAQHEKIHSAVKNEKCHICSQYFCNKTSLKKHLRRHTGEKPYTCEMCGDKFITSTMLRSHIISQHDPVQDIKCPLCENSFKAVKTLRLHFKNVHWKVKGEAFDIRKVPGLTEEEYDLFRDRRRVVLD